MRLIGASERGMQMMVQRALSRKAFGKLIAEHGSFRSDVAKVVFFYILFCQIPFFARKTISSESLEENEKPVVQSKERDHHPSLAVLN